MGAVAQVNNNRHGKAALAQASFGGFVSKGGSLNDSGVLEIIVPDAQASVRWTKHGYPSSLAKWHYHPHIEIHLIREGTGLMMAGNAVVPYEAGQVALIGSNLPHNWVSDIAPGERLRQRDVVCHVRPETMRLLMSGFPETSGFAMVLKRAGQALVLSGESARQAGSILESMEEHSLACRVSDLIRVLDVFAHAPADESYTVVASGYDPAVCSGAESVVNDAIEYISSHLSGEISMDLAARQAGMSVSAFSRLFKRAAGIGFSDFVRRLRIGHACRLLTTTNQSVASIRRACGYGNASNFNRRFFEETGETPTGWRKKYIGRTR